MDGGLGFLPLSADGWLYVRVGDDEEISHMHCITKSARVESARVRTWESNGSLSFKFDNAIKSLFHCY